MAKARVDDLVTSEAFGHSFSGRKKYLVDSKRLCRGAFLGQSDFDFDDMIRFGQLSCGTEHGTPPQQREKRRIVATFDPYETIGRYGKAASGAEINCYRPDFLPQV